MKNTDPPDRSRHKAKRTGKKKISTYDAVYEEVGDLLGVSPSMLSRLERGERRVRPLDRVRFARLLGARIAELFPTKAA